jgi:hypothetical protein
MSLGSYWDLEIPKVLKASPVIIAPVSESLNTAYYAREKITTINEVISQLKKF